VSFEITEEMQRRYRVVIDFRKLVNPFVHNSAMLGIADDLRDAVAAWGEAQCTIWEEWSGAPDKGWTAAMTKWTPEQWKDWAHKRLMGEL
jgi:hypothetical protein